jgi:peroxiredoxin
MKAAGIRKLQVGNTPPDFTMKQANGAPVNFDQIAKRKKATLVLFWASFCHKCEREIPAIQSVYNQYKNKGFEIIGVSVDTDRNDWLSGIKEHNTSWPNVADLEGWRGETAKDFRVTSTPVMFLVNDKREIIAKPGNAAELTSVLQKELGS